MATDHVTSRRDEGMMTGRALARVKTDKQMESHLNSFRVFALNEFASRPVDDALASIAKKANENFADLRGQMDPNEDIHFANRQKSITMETGYQNLLNNFDEETLDNLDNWINHAFFENIWGHPTYDALLKRTREARSATPVEVVNPNDPTGRTNIMVPANLAYGFQSRVKPGAETEAQKVRGRTAAIFERSTQIHEHVATLAQKMGWDPATPHGKEMIQRETEKIEAMFLKVRAPETAGAVQKEEAAGKREGEIPETEKGKTEFFAWKRELKQVDILQGFPDEASFLRFSKELAKITATAGMTQEDYVQFKTELSAAEKWGGLSIEKTAELKGLIAEAEALGKDKAVDPVKLGRIAQLVAEGKAKGEIIGVSEVNEADRERYLGHIESVEESKARGKAEGEVLTGEPLKQKIAQIKAELKAGILEGDALTLKEKELEALEKAKERGQKMALTLKELSDRAEKIAYGKAKGEVEGKGAGVGGKELTAAQENSIKTQMRSAIGGVGDQFKGKLPPDLERAITHATARATEKYQSGKSSTMAGAVLSTILEMEEAETIPARGLKALVDSLVAVSMPEESKADLKGLMRNFRKTSEQIDLDNVFGINTALRKWRDAITGQALDTSINRLVAEGQTHVFLLTNALVTAFAKNPRVPVTEQERMIRFIPEPGVTPPIVAARRFAVMEGYIKEQVNLEASIASDPDAPEPSRLESFAYVKDMVPVLRMLKKINKKEAGGGNIPDLGDKNLDAFVKLPKNRDEAQKVLRKFQQNFNPQEWKFWKEANPRAYALMLEIMPKRKR